MNFVFIIAVLFGVTYGQSCSGRCGSRGPAVCGTDGKTYKNSCYLKCLNSHHHVLLAHSGACTSIDTYTNTNCDQICNDEEGQTRYCLSNGKTYDSMCDVQNAKCAAAKKNHHLSVVHKGGCVTLNSSCTGSHSGTCQTVHNYLCGTNGYTYMNECYFKQAQCRLAVNGTMLDILHTGLCHDTSTNQSRNIDCSKYADMSYAGLAVEGITVRINHCPDTHGKQVCADGATYSSDCAFCKRMAATHKISYTQLNIPIGHDGRCVYSPIVGKRR